MFPFSLLKMSKQRNDSVDVHEIKAQVEQLKNNSKGLQETISKLDDLLKDGQRKNECVHCSHNEHSLSQDDKYRGPITERQEECYNQRCLERQRENENINHEKSKLEDKLLQMKEENTKHKTEILDLKREQEGLRREEKKLSKLNETLNTQLGKQQKEYKDLQENWKHEKESLENEIRRLKESIPKCRTIKQISFKSALKKEQSDQAIHDIKTLLSRKMTNVDLEIIQEAERSEHIPLFVVFYKCSRMSDDANGALKGVKATSAVCLVALHPKHSVCSNDLAKNVLTEPYFKKLGLIVDLSFLSAKGIIENELTNSGVDQIVQFIKRF